MSVATCSNASFDGANTVTEGADAALSSVEISDSLTSNANEEN